MHEETGRRRERHARRCLDVRRPGVARHVVAPHVVLRRLVMFSADREDGRVVDGQEVADRAAGERRGTENGPLVGGDVVSLDGDLRLLVERVVDADASDDVQDGVVGRRDHRVKPPRAVHRRTVGVDATWTCHTVSVDAT